MNYYMVTIPILAKYGNQGETYDKRLYFKGENGPTLEQVRQYCERLNQEETELSERPLQSGPIDFEAEDCLRSLRNFSPSWPIVTGYIVSANTFVIRDDFDPYHNYPLTVERIDFCDC